MPIKDIIDRPINVKDLDSEIQKVERISFNPYAIVSQEDAEGRIKYVERRGTHFYGSTYDFNSMGINDQRDSRLLAAIKFLFPNSLNSGNVPGSIQEMTWMISTFKSPFQSDIYLKEMRWARLAFPERFPTRIIERNYLNPFLDFIDWAFTLEVIEGRRRTNPFFNKAIVANSISDSLKNKNYNDYLNSITRLAELRLLFPDEHDPSDFDNLFWNNAKEKIAGLRKARFVQVNNVNVPSFYLLYPLLMNLTILAAEEARLENGKISFAIPNYQGPRVQSSLSMPEERKF